jgi:hypothetical protein
VLGEAVAPGFAQGPGQRLAQEAVEEENEDLKTEAGAVELWKTAVSFSKPCEQAVRGRAITRGPIPPLRRAAVHGLVTGRHFHSPPTHAPHDPLEKGKDSRAAIWFA